MKKIIICAMAFMAIAFANCGNKQNGSASDADSLANDTVAVSADDEAGDIDALTEELKAKIEEKDAKSVTGILGTAKQKIDELVKEGKVEEAKAYASKIKQFVDENAESIKAVTNGDATINGIVNTITSLPTSAEDAVNAAGDAVKSDAENAVSSAKSAAENKVSETKAAAAKKANDAVDNAKQKTNEAVDKAASKALNKLGL